MKLSMPIAALVLATSSLAKTDICNHDDLLECFTNRSSLAKAFCSSYLKTPITTITISTITPVSDIIVPTTVATETDISTSTTVSTSYSLVESITTATVFTTTTITTPPGPVKIRQVQPPDLDFIEDFIKMGRYGVKDILSACSCISVPASTVSVTATAPTSTSTGYLPETTTTSTTTIVEVVTVVSSTETLSATTTTTSVAPYPTTCPAMNGIDYLGSNGSLWERICGEAYDLSDQVGSPIKTSSLDACIELCIQYNEAGNSPPCIGVTWAIPTSDNLCYLQAGGSLITGFSNFASAQLVSS